MKRFWTSFLCGIGMIILILDTKTAIAGAYDGISLCIRSVIPSLFPFFVLSGILTGALTGIRGRILAPIGRFCGMPRGSESILLTGLLGGYPIGAKSVAESYRNGQIDKNDAKRMLDFAAMPVHRFCLES